MKSEITVIIPTYKPQKYIEDCIDSLLKQTLCKGKYDVLIVINGEKEPYFSNLKERYKDYSFIKIIYTPEKGVSNARNIGILESENDYLVFVDDDDFVSKHFLKSLYDRRIKNGIVVSNTLTIDENNKIGVDYLGKHFKNRKVNEKKKNLIFHRQQLSTSWGKLISKQIISKKFNTFFKIGEDALFMCENSEKIEKIEYANSKCIYYRRIRRDSVTRKKEKKLIILKRKKDLILKYFRLVFKLKKNKLFILSRILAQLKN